MPRQTDKKPAAKKTIKVETVTHKDQRTNIPTEELRGFVAEEEKSPKTLLYPRDPSLDPQLVWKPLRTCRHTRSNQHRIRGGS